MAQYPKNWTSESVEKYITQESRQKSREEFEATHIPIKRIKVTQNNIPEWEDGSDVFIDEKDFLDAVVDSSLSDSNRLFFVVGESGSGKSELCQWIDYQIQDLSNEDDADGFQHTSIHIPREVREPREVFERLTEYVDEDTLEEAKTLAELPRESVYESTIGDIGVQFRNDMVATVDLIQDEDFRSTVRKNLEEFIESYDDPSQELEFEPVPRGKLTELVQRYPGVQDEHADKAASVDEVLYNTITRAAKESIRDMLFLGDLKATLSQINERFQSQNRRPVLIIEDLTGFTIFQHEILSFFSDLAASNWDVVIGLTTGKEQKLVQGRRADITSEDTINDRIKARVTLTEQTDEGSKTLFLEQENVHIELARKYLNAIKTDSDIAYSPQLSIRQDELDEAFGYDLYPFNEKFLDRVYDNLREKNKKKQTPRIYLNFVIEGLLTNENPPFQHAELLGRLGSITNPMSSDYQEADRDLLKWYGHEEDERYVVDSRIPEVFNVESDGWAPIVDEEVLCGSCGNLMVEKEQGVLVCEECDTLCDECGSLMEREGEFWVCTENSDHRHPVGGLGQLFANRQQSLLDWRGEGMDFHQTSELKDGAEAVLRFFYDDPTTLVRMSCRSDQAASIWWSKGSSHVPVHIDNGDQPDYRKVVLDPELPESLLLDLLRIGVYDQSVEEHIENGTVDSQLLRKWADSTVEQFQSDLESDIINRFNVSLDEIALFGKYLANLFANNGSEFTEKSLIEPIDPDKINPATRPDGLDSKIKNLESHADTLSGLFHARFHLRSNMVDYHRVKRHVDQTDPDEIARRMGNVAKGIRGFKIGPRKSDAIDLSEFLTTSTQLNIRSYARDITEYQDNYETDKEEAVRKFGRVADLFVGIESIDEVDTSSVEEAYGQVSGARPEELNDIQEMDEDDLLSMLTKLEEDISTLRQADSSWKFIDAYQRIARIRYIDYPDEYKVLDRFVKELDSLEKNLKTEIHKFEGETVDPDTSHFNEAQSEADTLANLLEGDA